LPPRLLDDVVAGSDGRATLVTEQAGEWDVIVAPPSTATVPATTESDKKRSSSGGDTKENKEENQLMVLRIRLYVGTTILHQGDVIPVFGEAAPCIINHSLPTFAAQFHRKV
jgi:hypothetical protein